MYLIRGQQIAERYGQVVVRTGFFDIVDGLIELIELDEPDELDELIGVSLKSKSLLRANCSRYHV